VTLYTSGSSLDRYIGKEDLLLLQKPHNEEMLLAKSCNILVGKNLMMVPVRSSVSQYLFSLDVFKIYFVKFLISPIHVTFSAHLIHSGLSDEIIFV